MQKDQVIELTAKQINRIKRSQKILRVHSVTDDGTLIFVCKDGRLQAATFQGNVLEFKC